MTETISSEPAETPELTAKDVARAIGWLDAMDDRIDFDSANWSTVNDDGRIIVEGYADLDEGRHWIRADFALIGFEYTPCPEDDDEDYGEDEDDDDDD